MKNELCVIVAAGDVSSLKARGFYTLAADGGLKRAEELGLKVDGVLGDFDSYGSVPAGDKVEVYPTKKDKTDTALCCDLAVEQGYEKLLIYGALGGERFDHSYANLALCAELAKKGVKCVLCSEECSVFAICDSKLEFDGECRGYVSIFPFGGDADIKISGLEYGFDGVMEGCSSLGVSNEFCCRPSFVEVRGGVAIVICHIGEKKTVETLEAWCD